MAEKTTKEAVERALVEAGFVQDKSNPHKWTRPSKLEWVDDDEVHLLPYSTKETGRRFLATMTRYVNDEDILALLRGASPLVSLEDVEKAFFTLFDGQNLYTEEDENGCAFMVSREEAWQKMRSRLTTRQEDDR